VLHEQTLSFSLPARFELGIGASSYGSSSSSSRRNASSSSVGGGGEVEGSQGAAAAAADFEQAALNQMHQQDVPSSSTHTTATATAASSSSSSSASASASAAAATTVTCVNTSALVDELLRHQLTEAEGTYLLKALRSINASPSTRMLVVSRAARKVKPEFRWFTHWLFTVLNGTTKSDEAFPFLFPPLFRNEQQIADTKNRLHEALGKVCVLCVLVYVLVYVYVYVYVLVCV